MRSLKFLLLADLPGGRTYLLDLSNGFFLFIYLFISFCAVILPSAMAMDDTESCSSRPADDFSAQTWRQKQKVGVYDEVLRRLRLSHEAETCLPGFEDELWTHFHRLPSRYATLNLALVPFRLFAHVEAESVHRFFSVFFYRVHWRLNDCIIFRKCNQIRAKLFFLDCADQSRFMAI